jgi:hypothetical protein
MISQPSDYSGQPVEKWRGITDLLLGQHPLKPDEIREVALLAWEKVWETTIGSGKVAIRLTNLNVPATVVGYFFEVLFAREMQLRYPNDWRGNQSGDEKDLVYVNDDKFSVEIKTSGQLGDRVYGNRSYGQEVTNQAAAKKEKSGYYITANFYERTLHLIRFGWIDASDWRPQSSPTGQMAGLSDDVYKHKLILIPGDYQLNAPVGILGGVGEVTAGQFRELNIHTVRDLLASTGDLPARLSKIREKARQAYRSLGGSGAKE